MTEKGDRYTPFYSVLVAVPMLLVIFGHELDRTFHLYLLLVPLILIPIFVIGLICLFALIRNAVRQRWRSVVSIIAAPFLAYGVLTGLGAAGVNPDGIRFALGRPSYLAQIAELPKSDEPRFKLFDWGSTGGVGVGSITFTLIYDENDEIGLPSEQRSAAWRGRMEKTCPDAKICSIVGLGAYNPEVQIKKIGEHFFLATEFYP